MAATTPLPPMPADPQQIFTLTAADRCDVRNCNARAYVRVIVSGMLELTFCAHHGHEKETVLVDVVHDFIDESAAILK